MMRPFGSGVMFWGCGFYVFYFLLLECYWKYSAIWFSLRAKPIWAGFNDGHDSNGGGGRGDTFS
jgi:hypothetical protein